MCQLLRGAVGDGPLQLFVTEIGRRQDDMTDVRARLLEAASYLDDVAAQARWNAGESYPEGRWMVAVAGPLANTQWLGPQFDVLTSTWQQAVLVNLCSPDIVQLLAELLRTEARNVFGDEDHSTCETTVCPSMAALALAEHVLKEKRKAT
jgi:hypothetical protein